MVYGVWLCVSACVNVLIPMSKCVGMETIPVGDVFYVPSGQTPCHSDHTHQQTITGLITNGNSELMWWYMCMLPNNIV